MKDVLQERKKERKKSVPAVCCCFFLTLREVNKVMNLTLQHTLMEVQDTIQQHCIYSFFLFVFGFLSTCGCSTQHEGTGKQYKKKKVIQKGQNYK